KTNSARLQNIRLVLKPVREFRNTKVHSFNDHNGTLPLVHSALLSLSFPISLHGIQQLSAT
uniref:Uncharacterized protein n=1 Tax=Panthera leo TaxID=9689 RepID=A0A8C8Y9C5_PANLE